MAESLDLEMVRGDTFAFNVSCVTDVPDGITFSLKKSTADTEYIFQKTIGDGITRVDETTFQVRIAPGDTSGVAAGRYTFDIQLEYGDDVYTPVIGKLKITQDVTIN